MKTVKVLSTDKFIEYLTEHKYNLFPNLIDSWVELMENSAIEIPLSDLPPSENE